MLQRKTFAVASIAATIYLIQSTTCPVAKAASEHNNLQHVSFPAFRGKPSPAKDAVQKLISANYSCSVPLRDDFTELSFAVGDDGVIYDPEILHSSNNDQHDAECLEALCGLSPLNVKPGKVGMTLDHMSFRFGKDQLNSYVSPTYLGPDVREYWQTHQKPSNPTEAVVLVHKIPLFILVRYPSLFSKDELLSASNLVSLKVGHKGTYSTKDGQQIFQPQYVELVQWLYGYWTKSLKDRGPVTRQTILEHAKPVEHLINQ